MMRIRIMLLLIVALWIVGDAAHFLHIVPGHGCEKFEARVAAFVGTPQLGERLSAEGALAASRPLGARPFPMCSARSYLIQPIATTSWSLQQAPALRRHNSIDLHGKKEIFQRRVILFASTSGADGGRSKKGQSNKRVSLIPAHGTLQPVSWARSLDRQDRF